MSNKLERIQPTDSRKPIDQLQVEDVAPFILEVCGEQQYVDFLDKCGDMSGEELFRAAQACFVRMTMGPSDLRQKLVNDGVLAE